MRKNVYLCINLNLPAMKRKVLFIVCVACLAFFGCEKQQMPDFPVSEKLEIMNDMVSRMEDRASSELTFSDIELIKDLLYDRYTPEDVYPYGDTVRSFKWVLGVYREYAAGYGALGCA